ncbi:hypothetical protein Hdeb2414_s0020g00555231 [Helianthus debilis subsp. tardiflorus]
MSSVIFILKLKTIILRWRHYPRRCKEYLESCRNYTWLPPGWFTLLLIKFFLDFDDLIRGEE